MNLIIDMHCHPSMKPHGRNYSSTSQWLPDDLWKQKPNANPGGVLARLIRRFFNMVVGDEQVILQSQSTMHLLAKGNVKIAGASIFSYERGWTDPKLPLSGTGSVAWLSGLSLNKVNDIHHYQFSYWDDAIREFNYMIAEQQNHPSDTEDPNSGFKFQILKPGMAKNMTLQQLENGSTVFLFITFEGVQNMRTDNDNTNDDLSSEVSAAEATNILNNIKTLKAHPFRPMIMNLCHHYSNRVAGHARSVLPVEGIKPFDQEQFLDTGLTETAKQCIIEMLKDDNQRILIDIKHMSAIARKQFYQLLKSDPVLKTKQIPIVSSHTGFTFDRDLPDIITDINNGDNDKPRHLRGYYHNWSINMTATDVNEIIKSKGIIGLQLDLKRLTGKAGLDLYIKKPKTEANKKYNREVSARMVWANIFRAAINCGNAGIWEVLSIGSDYDGIVTSLPGFEYSESFTMLKTEMLNQLNVGMDLKEFGIKQTDITNLNIPYTNDELVEKIFCKNAWAFIQNNY